MNSLPAMGGHHHRSWVGPPEYYDRIGALQFLVLVLLGIREYHKLLDIGCGSLRGGRFAIMYLNPGNYFGTEPLEWVLRDGIAHELSTGLLDLKKPTFDHNPNFDVSSFGVRFDFAMASGIFMHAAPSQIERCFEGVAQALAPDGVFVGAFLEGDRDSGQSSWTYPEVQRYTPEGLSAMAGSAKLRITHVAWPHTFGHRWFVATHNVNDREFPAELDLSVFSWPEYLADQIVARGGRRRGYADYLKEDLVCRTDVAGDPGLLPQVMY